MSRSKQKGKIGGWLGSSPLMDRLAYVRKRKQAHEKTFGGQTVDMDAVQRRLEAKRRQKRGR